MWKHNSIETPSHQQHHQTNTHWLAPCITATPAEVVPVAQWEPGVNTLRINLFQVQNGILFTVKSSAVFLNSYLMLQG